MPWEQLEQSDKQTYLEDVSRVLAIRRANRDLLNADRWENAMVAVPSEPEAMLVPYARFRYGEKAIIVAGNEGSEPLRLTLSLPLEKLGLPVRGSLVVKDLWRGGEQVLSVDDLRHGLDIVIGADTELRGGLAVLQIAPIDQDP